MAAVAEAAEVDDNELGSATEGTKPSSAVAAKPAKVAEAQAAKAKAKTAASASAVSHVDRERALGNNRGLASIYDESTVFIGDNLPIVRRRDQQAGRPRLLVQFIRTGENVLSVLLSGFSILKCHSVSMAYSVNLCCAFLTSRTGHMP